MSDETTLTAPLAVFGDPASTLWGVLAAGAQPSLLLTTASDESAATPLALSQVEVDLDDGEVWTITGPGIDLKLELADASTVTYEDGSVLVPCQLSGFATVDGSERELDIPGVTLVGAPEGKLGQVRVVGSWFPGGHEISLASFRGPKAKGHDGEDVDVIARGEEQQLVFEPRLSTTYNGDGSPRKTGIELWLGNDDEGDHYPRRVSGVASGARASGKLDQLSFSAHALHCLSRGEAGSGVYVLLNV